MKTNGEECDEFVAWAKQWNDWPKDHPAVYKNGRPKPERKRPVDALCVVRAAAFEERLVWDEAAKNRALQELLEEEERLREAGYDPAEGH